MTTPPDPISRALSVVLNGAVEAWLKMVTIRVESAVPKAEPVAVSRVTISTATP